MRRTNTSSPYGPRQLNRPHRSSERGSALVIVLLLILTLTALGLIGMKQTTFEFRSTRNLKLQQQAAYVSEGALTLVVDQVGQNGQAYWELMDRLSKARNVDALASNEAANYKPSYQFTRNDLAPNALMFAGPAQSVGACNVASPPPECQGLESDNGYYADTTRLPNFQVLLQEPKDGPKAPGFSHEFCFKRFRLNASGSVGQAPSPTDVLEFDKPVQGAASEHQAHVLVGPLDCGGYYR